MRSIIPLSLILSLLLLSSCVNEETIQFRSIKNVWVNFNKSLLPYLNLELVFHNATSLSMTIKKIHATLILVRREMDLVVVDQELDLEIDSESEFVVPIEVKLKLTGKKIMDFAFDLSRGKEQKVRCVGHIRMSFYGFIYQIPFEYEQILQT